METKVDSVEPAMKALEGLECFRQCKSIVEMGCTPDEAIKCMNVPEEHISFVRKMLVNGNEKNKTYPNFIMGKSGSWILDKNSPENMAHLIQETLEYEPRMNLLKNLVYSGIRTIDDTDLSKMMNEVSSPT